jgi:hypothetical protein
MEDRARSRARETRGQGHPKRALVAGLLFGFGLLLGWLLGGRWGSRTPVIQKAEQTPGLTNGGRFAAAHPAKSFSTTGTALERLRASLTPSIPGGRLDIVGCLASISELSAAECALALDEVRDLRLPERRLLIAAVVQQWARADPPGAFTAALRERHDNDLRNQLGEAAAAEWVAVNPEAALARVASAPRQWLEKPAEWVLGALAKVDPWRAAGFIGTKATPRAPEHIFRGIASQLGAISIDEALQWASTLSTSRLQDEVKRAAWQGFAQADPARAASVAAGHQLSKRQSEEIYRTIAAFWSRKDPTAALAWIGSLPDGERKNEAFQSFGPDWSTLSKAEFRTLIDATPREDAKIQFAVRFAGELARKDVPGALAWAASLPEVNLRAKTMRPIIAEWSATDPAAAVQYAAALGPGDDRSGALEAAASAWAQSDPQAVLAYAMQMPSGKERDQTLFRAISAIGNDDPRTALESINKVEDGGIRASAVERLIGDLARTDAQAAISLANGIPEENQPKVFHQLIRGWAFDHPTEAGEWINELPRGKARDAAVGAYVSVIDGTDPALATKWARTIDDPAERPEATIQGLSRRMEKDSAAAAAWVQENPFPEGLQPLVDKLFKEAEQRKKRD